MLTALRCTYHDALTYTLSQLLEYIGCYEINITIQ